MEGGRTKDVDMTQNDEEEDRVTKRKRMITEAAKAESEVPKQDDSALLVKKLMEKLDQKDDQISKMLETIEGLRSQIQAMNDTLTQMRAKDDEI